MSTLSIQIINGDKGKPVAGIGIELWQVGKNDEIHSLKMLESNAKGSTAKPLLSGASWQSGTYEIRLDLSGQLGKKHPLATIATRININKKDKALKLSVLFNKAFYAVHFHS